MAQEWSAAGRAASRRQHREFGKGESLGEGPCLGGQHGQEEKGFSSTSSLSCWEHREAVTVVKALPLTRG